jgi:signal transduction histidine kinase/DNA-binding response OmpR family regulator
LAANRPQNSNPKLTLSSGSVDILIQRAEVLLSRNIDQAFALLNDALAIARREEYRKGLAGVHYCYGQCYQQQSNYKKSLTYFNEALQLFGEIDDRQGSIKCLNEISAIYFKLGDSFSALEHSLKRLRLYTQINDEHGVGYGLNEIGKIFLSLLEYDKAVDHFRRALKIYEARKNKKEMVQSYYLLGAAYNGLDEFEKSQYYLLRGLNSFDLIDDVNIKVNTLAALANLHTKLKEYDRALNYFHEAIGMANLGASATVKAQLNKNLGHLYLDLTQYDKAIDVLQKALKIAHSSPLESQLINIHKYLSSAFEKTGDFEKALYHFRKFYEEDKLVTSQEINLKTKGLQIKFDLEEMKKQKEIAELSDKLKEQFLANVSHEIRTPMNGILGMAHLLTQTQPTKEQREYIAAISQSANNLMAIISDILDFSKINAGKIDFAETEFNLRDLIKSVMQILQVKAAEKGLQFNCVLDYHIPDVLIGDAIRLNQILINLLGNAVKFTEKGKVTLDIRETVATDNYVSLRFSVIDTGIGIQEEKLNNIFESFEQANNNVKRFEGTGLGLTIVKKLVELQGGNIKVKSEFGKGSEFSFELTFKSPPTPQRGDRKPSKVENTNPPFGGWGGFSILIVEDNKVNQLLVRNMLKNFGFTRFDSAENGKVALEQLRKNTYDLILMDIQMPDMSGFEITNQIRNNMLSRFNRDVPIIALTADASEKEKARARQTGMNDYVVKPYTPEELYAAIVGQIGETEKGRIGDVGKRRHDERSYSPILPISDSFSPHSLDKYTGGDNELAVRLIEILLRQVPEAISKLETLIPERDWKHIHSVVHKLKGSMAVFEFHDLKRILIRMEEYSANKENIDEIALLFTQFKRKIIFSVEGLERELTNLKGLKV